MREGPRKPRPRTRPRRHDLLLEALEPRTLLTTLTSISITPAPTTLLQYSTQQFTAVALDEFSNPLTPQPQFTWTLAGVGNIDSAGLYSGAFAGNATITATTGSNFASTTLSVIAPILWLRNDAITPNPAALDSSPNNFNTLITGTFGSDYSSVPGEINNALNLSGTANSAGFVTLNSAFASAFQATTDFTVMSWVKLPTLNNGAHLFDFNNNTTARYMFLAPADASGLPRFAITTAGPAAEKSIQGNTALTTGAWHFLAFSLAGTIGTLYLDGNPIGSAAGMTINPGVLGLTLKDYIGKSANPTDPNFKGGIDDFRIYSGASTAAGISQMYALGLSAPTHMPAVANPANASPANLTGRTSVLSALGSERASESNLLYTWSATGTPPGAVTFSRNGSNLAKSTTATFSKVGTYTLLVTISDPLGYTVTSTTSVTINAAVVGRSIFYKGSSFDTSSDNAIAPDKTALLPGQPANFANYTSFASGINGIMLDYSGPATNFTTADFLFNVGNDNNPAAWPAAPLPLAVTTRPGAGLNGSTRIEITWTDGTIAGQWLQITLKGGATSNSGLNADDVFYFGNAIGESGNSPGDTKVDAFDQLAPRFAAANNVPITNSLDYDRSGTVDSQDENIARNCYTYFLNQLQLILPPAPPVATPLLAPAFTLPTISRSSPVSLAPANTQASFIPTFDHLAVAPAQRRSAHTSIRIPIQTLAPRIKFKPLLPL